MLIILGSNNKTFIMLETIRHDVVITFGTYDLFHIGHLNIINEAQRYGNKLIVGVSSDELNYKKKGHYPTINQDDRMKIISCIRGVHDVFLEESLEEKISYCKKYNASICIMGDDHKGKFDFLKEHGIEMIYLPRTPLVSSTDIKKEIKNN